MAFYTGYFDDSGHETSDFLGCGGLVIETHSATAFDLEWKQAIAPLDYLHTTDFVAGEGDFSAWQGRHEEKCEILGRVARLLAKVSFQTFSAILGMEDYRRIDKELAISEFIAYPFSLCARFSDIQVRQWAHRNGITEEIDLVFERRPALGEIVEVFERDGVPPPSFRDKKTLPLQAADFVAWTYCGKVLNSSGYNRFKNVLSGLPASLHTHDYISYSTILGICRRMHDNTGMEVPPRNELVDPVAFHTSKKRDRKKFSSREH